jgi:hypothetical protein
VARILGLLGGAGDVAAGGFEGQEKPALFAESVVRLLA